MLVLGIGRVGWRSDQCDGVGDELRARDEVEWVVGVVEDAGNHVAAAVVSVEVPGEGEDAGFVAACEGDVGPGAYVEVDATTLWSENLYYYDGSEVCGWNRGWSGSYDDLHEISETTAHTASSLELVAGSTLNQDASDESFGIDDVFVWIR